MNKKEIQLKEKLKRKLDAMFQQYKEIETAKREATADKLWDKLAAKKPVILYKKNYRNKFNIKIVLDEYDGYICPICEFIDFNNTLEDVIRCLGEEFFDDDYRGIYFGGSDGKYYIGSAKLTEKDKIEFLSIVFESCKKWILIGDKIGNISKQTIKKMNKQIFEKQLTDILKDSYIYTNVLDSYFPATELQEDFESLRSYLEKKNKEVLKM